MIEPGGIELSAKEIDRLQQIVAAPEDVEQLIDIAEVSRDEFLSFMDEMGFWDDPEYAKFAGQVLSELGQREDRKQLAEVEPIDGMRDARRRGETRWTSIDWWRQSFGRAAESFLVCCRENVLVQAIMGRTVVKRRRPAKATSTDFWQQLAVPTQANNPFASIGLALAATAAVVVSIASLMFSLHHPISERVVTTGDHQTTSIRLSDGTMVILASRSRIEVSDEEGPTVVAGEAIFQVSHDAREPLLVETFRATARAFAGAKFRVKIDSSVEFELLAGVVQVFPRGAHGETAAITLKKGSPYRIPVHVHGAMAARARDGVSAKPFDGQAIEMKRSATECSRLHKTEAPFLNGLPRRLLTSWRST